eukprot:m.211453 g.211453  ORF g.211453 m.211453 type:complete len:64 (+) comp39759_c0_seq55:97-288(+)
MGDTSEVNAPPSTLYCTKSLQDYKIMELIGWDGWIRKSLSCPMQPRRPGSGDQDDRQEGDADE